MLNSPRDGGPGRQSPVFVLFHHAGGASSVFHGWTRPLSVLGEVVSVDLPGRRRRLREPLLRDAAAAVADLATVVRGALGPPPGPPVAMLGHSMGALLAYEVACLLRDEGYAEPGLLVVSGSRAPGEYGRSSWLSHLDSVGFMSPPGDELSALGARPPGPEQMALLAADLEICGSHQNRGQTPLTCPIVALTGNRDPVAPFEEAERWAQRTTGGFRHREYPGAHFFLFDEAVIDEVIGGLECWANHAVRRAGTWEC